MDIRPVPAITAQAAAQAAPQMPSLVPATSATMRLLLHLDVLGLRLPRLVDGQKQRAA